MEDWHGSAVFHIEVFFLDQFCFEDRQTDRPTDRHTGLKKLFVELKNVLRKSSYKLNDLQLMEICFAINSHISMEGSRSNNECFLGRSVRTCVPNSINPNLNTGN